MTVRNLRLTLLSCLALPFLLLLLSQAVSAQDGGPGSFTTRPSVGLQTIKFPEGTPPANAIHPEDDRNGAPGGGFSSANNGLRIQLELMPDSKGMFRIPLSFEYFEFIGKTTFVVTRYSDTIRKQFVLIRHDASMFSFGAGVTAAFFDKPNLYFSVEGKVNMFPTPTYYSRFYFYDNDSTLSDKTTELYQDTKTRFGGYARIGTQLDFFDPLMIDLSIGGGVLNMFGKDTDPQTQRNLLAVDPYKPAEETLVYLGAGLSLIYEF